MKILLMGNAGAGKTTLSRKLMGTRPVGRLSLDEVAFSGSETRLPLDESIGRVNAFVAAHDSWIIEGCYADIIEAVLDRVETLVFLNPGVATCIEHCRRRPWEPEKFASPDEQHRMLENLVAWVSQYELRDDEYGLKEHRRLYDSFAGRKFEFTSTEHDAVQQILAADA